MPLLEPCPLNLKCRSYYAWLNNFYQFILALVDLLAIKPTSEYQALILIHLNCQNPSLINCLTNVYHYLKEAKPSLNSPRDCLKSI